MTTNDVASLPSWYEKFDAWTQRTGILDGSGLTWVVRWPLNILLLVVLPLLIFLVALLTGALSSLIKRRRRATGGKVNAKR